MRLDPVTLEILWTRLVSMVDEAAAAFVRACFSTVVREANDYAVVLCDREGRALAQSSLSIPSFIGTLPATVRHFLRIFPPPTLKPGDAIITNDPWLATGHLPDVSMAMPIFRNGELVAIAAIVSHLPDIGGRLWNTGIRELYEEGLQIPPVKLVRAGEPDPTLVAMIAQNVRTPEQTLGDIWGQLAACRMLEQRVLAILGEDVDLTELGNAICARSEARMRDAITAIPDGDYVASATGDGFEAPVEIHCRITVNHDALTVDYAGSSPQLARSVNVVPGYAFAYSAFCLKAVLAPDVPNNDGSTKPLSVTAPLGSILNPRYPAPCSARGMTGQLLVPAIMTALSRAMPDGVQAAPGSPQCSFTIAGSMAGRRFATVNFIAGGMGAGLKVDGRAALSFPSNVANTPIEVMEATAPLRVERRALRRGSGGVGRRRGGDGQALELLFTGDEPAIASFILSRLKEPAPGLAGGGEGAVGRLLINGAAADPAGHHVLTQGTRILMETAGGGGFGVAQAAENAS